MSADQNSPVSILIKSFLVFIRLYELALLCKGFKFLIIIINFIYTSLK